ncbi:MAG: NnrS family protein [Proteobacteria bacterium]|nr:MAG: NnrS family protein [Pseudomonadota bacterium]
MTDIAIRRTDRTPALLACPFRPFFILTALYAIALIGAWAAFLFLALPLALGVEPALWHSHEMLFGVVPAAIAGFLLTAIGNWTGAAHLRGGGLLALAALWLAGRAAMWLSAVVPPWLVATLDMAFLPTLAIYAARVLIRHGNHRNLILAVMLGLLALCNLFMHLSFSGFGPHFARLGEVAAMDLVAVIMIVIGGRITPAFTANWLSMNARNPAVVQRSAKLDTWAMASALAMVPADLATGAPWLGAAAALVAAVVSGWRLLRWRGWHASGEPLLWILHLGLAWVVVALLLKALTPVAGLNPSAWMHALGAGAMGTLILGVMTRVAMGHTGRAIELRRGGIWIYAAITVAALSRLGAALELLDFQRSVALASAAWVVAFGLFAVLYWRILSQPRVDGKPG